MHFRISRLVSLFSLIVGFQAWAQPAGQTAEKLFVLPDGVQTHWASAENVTAAKGAGGQAKGGRKGSACFPVQAGEKVTLAEVSGTSGMVRSIWMTTIDRSPIMLRGLRLDMYWDGVEKPAVSAPIGDFFGHGLGRMATFESALFSSPEGRSFNCFVPMPFKTGMKIEITNETNIELPAFFYTIEYTTGDRHEANTLYFHAYYHRQNPTQLQNDYELLPKIEGRGRYLGVNVGVKVHNTLLFRTWWGEGEVKMYLDGDTEFPSLCGTGTEDYVGTAWGQGQYSHLYQGSPVSDNEKYEYCFYRLHIPDPVYFAKDIRVTIQQIGCWGPDSKADLATSKEPIYAAGPGQIPVDFSPAGRTEPYGLFERQDDCSSCAYFYLDSPTSPLPALAPLNDRVVQVESPPTEPTPQAQP